MWQKTAALGARFRNLRPRPLNHHHLSVYSLFSQTEASNYEHTIADLAYWRVGAVEEIPGDSRTRHFYDCMTLREHKWYLQG